MRLRILLFSTAVVGFILLLQLYAAGPSITVYKDPFCSCCALWVKHLEANGFVVTVREVENVAEYKDKYGVPSTVRSCHTAVVDGYTIEGHVPAAEIQRLLKERPQAKGLAVPGMPVGSPGMEVAGTPNQKYSVLLFRATGETSVYRDYAGQ
ncbi:MAG: metal-binding protein [Acidobacteria bacterium 13_1_40CM_2_56_5]|nr:MAG: metal-binding protein [Acidobacteria bacterium 13_1_40CM_2_56_5]